MDRREFLKILGLGGVALATPKFIFDMGAKLYRPNYEFITKSFDCGNRTGIAIQANIAGKLYRNGIIIDSHSPTDGEIAIAKNILITHFESYHG